MKNLENYGVQELDAMEMIDVSGGLEYAEYSSNWATYPNGVITPGTILGASIQNAGVCVYNAGVAVYNGAAWLWNQF